MDDYALAYIGMVPVEVIIITFSPLLVSIGYPWVMPIALLLVGMAIILIHKHFKLWGIGKNKV